MNETDEFGAVRERLHGIAYRMTGSVSDADDIVQEAWLRWSRADRRAIESVDAWLVRVTTNLAIDRSRSIATRRETYVGPYLPEPLIESPGRSAEDPAAQADLSDSLTFAFLVMLDTLDPTARAVLLLHDVFGYRFDEIAPMVDRSPTACRQIASRTRRHLAANREAAHRPDGPHQARALSELVTALAEGDIERVVTMLSPDVIVQSDAGPNRYAARRSVVGPHRASRLLVNLASRSTPTMTFELVPSNGLTALLVREADEPFLWLTISCDGNSRIARVWSQLNPEKLRHVR